MDRVQQGPCRCSTEWLEQVTHTVGHTVVTTLLYWATISKTKDT